MPTTSFMPPPERELPSSRLERRREHLLDAVGIEERPPPWKLLLGQKRYVWVALVVVTVAVAAIAGPAFGVVHAIRDLFEGAPPTPLVQKHFSEANEGVQKLTANPPPGLKLPLADTSKIHGVVSVNTSDGPVNLWAAPVGNDERRCWLVQFASDQNAENTVYGPSGCDIRTPVGSAVTWGDFRTTAHPSVRILVGEAFGGAESIKVKLSDGSWRTTPVTEHFFLIGHDPNAVPTEVSSLNGDGTVLTTSRHGNVSGG
jgi:hypothetical protein